MNAATRKFAYDVANHILRLHTSEESRCIVDNEGVVNNSPVLYAKFGKFLVQYYFEHHKESTDTFSSAVFDNSKLSRLNYRNRAENLIETSRLHDQSFHVFYNLCIKLILLGLAAMKKGIPDAIPYAIDKIDALAAEAYTRGDLDEKFDCMFNFAYDLLLNTFTWCGCVVELHWDLKKLNLDSNSFNYYDFYSSYFKNFLTRNGNAILNKFSTIASNPEMTREIFIFQMQDFSDAYYGQLGEVESVESLSNLLEAFMNISLLTVYAVKHSYTCSIRLAHESIVKLAISAEKNGLWTRDNREKLRNRSLMEF